jgi:tight adherence protein B
MGLPSITLLTFVSTVMLVISIGSLAYDWLLKYRLLVRERLHDLENGGVQERGVQLFKGGRPVEAGARLPAKERLKMLLEQAAIKCSLPAFVCVCLGFGAVCALMAVLIRGWIGMLCFPLGAAIPLAVVMARRQARRKKLCRQLPEAFQMISRAVRAGQTVQSALKIIAQDFESPISEEFALCYEQQNLGMSRESVFRKLAHRTGIMELQIFVVALLVQARSGGNLVELLDNLALTVRKRIKLSDRVRALTGEGRMQARVLLVLPVAALVGLLVLSPDYAAGLLQWPWLLALTAMAQGIGAFWIRRIINFQY